MKTTNQYQQNSILLIGCLSAVLGLAACQQEGGAEKAGQKIDKAVDNAGQKIEQTTEKAGQKVEAAKETVGQQAEKTGAYIDKSAEASKDALEKAGKQIDQAISNTGNKIETAKESVVDKAVATGEYIDDSAITVNVKTVILNDPVLKASQIEVTTVNGVVKLSGTVDSEQLVGRIIGLVNSQKNVKSVQNELMINASVPSKQ
ncbi:MAG: BON domain-containing protein [Methylococcaceae bacterium]|nr:BON domain-containing protein [Methylococcaceae bacterium]